MFLHSLVIYAKKLKMCPHKNLYTDIQISFIHDCQKLEGTKMSFRR